MPGKTIEEVRDQVQKRLPENERKSTILSQLSMLGMELCTVETADRRAAYRLALMTERAIRVSLCRKTQDSEPDFDPIRKEALELGAKYPRLSIVVDRISLLFAGIGL